MKSVCKPSDMPEGSSTTLAPSSTTQHHYMYLTSLINTMLILQARRRASSMALDPSSTSPTPTSPPTAAGRRASSPSRTALSPATAVSSTATRARRCVEFLMLFPDCFGGHDPRGGLHGLRRVHLQQQLGRAGARKPSQIRQPAAPFLLCCPTCGSIQAVSSP